MTMNRRFHTQTRAGFSLIELTLVLAIIGVLAAFAAYNMAGIGGRARIKATTANMQTVNTAIKMYHTEKNGQYPPDLQTLLTGANAYLDADKGTVDGWGRPFVYEPTSVGGKPYQLLSLGEDGIIHTEDDISIWTIPQE